MGGQIELKKVTVMTRFKLPTSQELPSLKNLGGENFYILKPWLPVLKPLMTAKGHKSTSWCGVEESPEVVILITSNIPISLRAMPPKMLIQAVDWLSLDDLDAFVASDACHNHEQALNSIVEGPIESRRYQLYGGHYAPNDSRIEVCTVYFHPAVIDDPKARSILLTHKGLCLPYTMGITEDSSEARRSPYDFAPRRGFSMDELTWNGKQVKAVVYENYWKSNRREEKFKEKSSKSINLLEDGGEISRRVSIFEDWACEMMRNGAFGWTSEHWVVHEIAVWWFALLDRSH